MICIVSPGSPPFILTVCVAAPRECGEMATTMAEEEVKVLLIKGGLHISGISLTVLGSVKGVEISMSICVQID